MKPLIELKNVVKKYDKIVLKKINFKISRGERVAIVGANGGGKSTMSEILSGIRQPTRGKVIKQADLVLGIQFQESKYPTGIVVIDMIKYYLETFNIAMTYGELDQLLETYQLSKFSGKLITDLSIGDQQRLNILLAIIHKPDVIVLDEISTGLDIQIRKDIFEFLEKNVMTKDVAVILITHQMNEVERFCNRLVFLHQGQIIERKTIKNVVDKYGSVQTYMQKMLKKHKGDDLKIKIKKTQPPLASKWIHKLKPGPSKGWSLWKLILKYYSRGLFVPLFLIFYPILNLFLLGSAIDNQGLANLRSLIQGITIVQIISIGIFVLPETILDYKKSVLMKRIGATNIKPRVFIVSIASLGFLFTVFAYFWSLLWAGIFFGNEHGWGNLLQVNHMLQSLPFLLILLVTATSFGMMLTAFFKSSSSFVVASNFAFVLISFLSGGFIPLTILLQSQVLQYVVYINPFYYVIDPYLAALDNIFVFNARTIGFIVASIGLLSVFVFVGIRNLKWQA